MTDARVYDEPSMVTAEEGVVLVDGPGGFALSMTPGAAEETGMRLRRAAEDARTQAKPRDGI